MENIDPMLAEDVWQRVHGQPKTNTPETLRTLVAREWTEAAVYLMLSRQLQGKEKAIVRKLFEEEQTHAACLRGIYWLITGDSLTTRTPPPTPEAPETALRKCYGRKLKAAAAYEARMQDPEYGAVFKDMARQERAHCRVILELIGDMRK